MDDEMYMLLIYVNEADVHEPPRGVFQQHSR
jgi:hypothetical protein